MKIFTERLQECVAGKTQRVLAQATGIPQQTLSRYLSGKQTPDLERLVILCRYLGVTADYLLGLEN
ncbi:MAG: helix-turn-helix transcriptional regulator [Clostridia bacterium]|nr:helix-turn-helix transcriptional regulator [Clostridia bacterium]